jgi:hypothetical protein
MVLGATVRGLYSLVFILGGLVGCKRVLGMGIGMGELRLCNNRKMGRRVCFKVVVFVCIIRIGEEGMDWYILFVYFYRDVMGMCLGFLLEAGDIYTSSLP